NGRSPFQEIPTGGARARGNRMSMGSSAGGPKAAPSNTKVGDWLDARTGYRALLSHALDEPVPGGARWAYIWGSVLVGCITLQAITGWAMMAYYAPSATTAWASVEHLTYGVSGGWLVRGLHHFGAQAMVVTVAFHIAQVAIFGAYKAPREV